MVKIVKGDFNLDTAPVLTKIRKIIKKLKISGDITIKFGDKMESESLNTHYRKKKYPTDVLSFPFNEKFPDSYYIGDIFICIPIAEEQAIQNSISLDEEIFTLICHGVLHLAGYDHEKDSGQMSELQDELINKYFA